MEKYWGLSAIKTKNFTIGPKILKKLSSLMHLVCNFRIDQWFLTVGMLPWGMSVNFCGAHALRGPQHGMRFTKK